MSLPVSIPRLVGLFAVLTAVIGFVFVKDGRKTDINARAD